jgi:hypothetical protein
MRTPALLLATAALFLAPVVHAQDELTGGTYRVQLQDLRSRVDENQDQVRLARQRLMAISKALSGPGLAHVDVDVSDETTNAFKLASAKVSLDGAVQYDRHDGIADQKTLPVFTGAIAPGEHTVRLDIVLQGNGYGVFTYLRGYKITLTSTHTFTAASDKPLHVTATAFELTDVTVPLERRPQISWRQ